MPIKNTQRVDVITCEKCGCTWFAKATINRYANFEASLFMSPMPVHYDADFSVLVCARCNHVVNPPRDASSISPGDTRWTLYQEMVTETNPDPGDADKANAGSHSVIQTFNVLDAIPKQR